MYYKLGQACVPNWGSLVLLKIRANVVTNWDSFIITNWAKCCYKLGQSFLQIGEKSITNWGWYYKLGHNINFQNGLCLRGMQVEFFIGITFISTCWLRLV